ncbi:glutamate decarboxylase 1-like, partial [Tachysurus ichikawai]
RFISVFFSGHPRFFNQLSTGLDIIGLAGEWLTSTANTNMRLCKVIVFCSVARGAGFVSAVSSDGLIAQAALLPPRHIRLHIDLDISKSTA